MKKLKHFLEQALLAEPESIRHLARSVQFDRKTIAALFIGGLKWFTVLRCIENRQPSEVEMRLLDSLTPDQWAEFVHDRLRRMS